MELFFSKQGIRALEPMVSDLIRRFCERLDSFKGTSTVVQLDHAFAAVTGDVITRICCDNHTYLIEDEQFCPSW